MNKYMDPVTQVGMRPGVMLSYLSIWALVGSALLDSARMDIFPKTLYLFRTSPSLSPHSGTRYRKIFTAHPGLPEIFVQHGAAHM